MQISHQKTKEIVANRAVDVAKIFFWNENYNHEKNNFFTTAVAYNTGGVVPKHQTGSTGMGALQKIIRL